MSHSTTNIKMSDCGMMPNYNVFNHLFLNKEIIHLNYISCETVVVVVVRDGQPILIKACILFS